MFKNLSQFLSPNSISIVGASRDEKKLGTIVLKNIISSGFKGQVCCVNPNTDEILGVKSYSSYSLIPFTPELVIISLPSKLVNPVLREIGQKGTKNVVVLSAGYKEIGEEGVLLEQELISIVDEYNLNLLGPNCLGFVNNHADLNASFGNKLTVKGNLRILSQSGAIATSMMDSAEEVGLGFSQFVTLGNKPALNEVDFLEYWLSQDESGNNQIVREQGASKHSPIGMYLESISDGERFIQTLKRLSLRNPVFMLKPGRSESAKHAMQSHTGSMAGSDKVLSQALKEVGVIRCEGIEELFDLAKAFSWENAPTGNKIAIVSNAGGPAVATTDFIEDAGLELSSFSKEIHEKLYEYLPRSASVANPIDILGDALAARYGYALELVLAQPNVDVALVILTPQVMTEIHETAVVIANVSRMYNKPVFCSFMGGKYIYQGEEVLSSYKLPNFRFPERAVNAIGKMWKWTSFVNSNQNLQDSKVDSYVSDEIVRVLENAKNQGRNSLDSLEADVVLKNIGVNVPPSSRVNSIEEAKNFCEVNGYPCVLKIISSKILHKSDLGGVKVNLNSEELLISAFNELSQIISTFDDEIRQECFIQAQMQVPKGVELILGVKRDQDFGAVIMFGAGGIYAELLEDSNLKIAPCSLEEAKELIKSSKIYKILNGYRGDQPFDITGLAEMIVKLGNLIVNYKQIQDFEINPIILTYESVFAVDGKCILS